MAGRRVQRVEDGVTKTWSYSGDNIASVHSSDTPNVHRVFSVAPGWIANALDRHDVDPTANGGDGSTTSQYYLYNHRGDVVGVTDASGVLKALHEYNAYGNVTTSYSSGSGAGPDEILFTGKDADLVSSFGDRILIKKDGYAVAARGARCPSDREESPGVWLMP